MGLDVLWGYDRRPVSMAVLRAKTGRSWPFLSGCQDGGTQDYHTTTYRQLSYYSFLLRHHNTHIQTERQTDTLNTQHLRHGELFGQRRRGAWQRPFLFSLVHPAGGRHITHHTRFLWWWRRTDENSSYHTTSIPRIFVRCCTSPP